MSSKASSTRHRYYRYFPFNILVDEIERPEHVIVFWAFVDGSDRLTNTGAVKTVRRQTQNKCSVCRSCEYQYTRIKGMYAQRSLLIILPFVADHHYQPSTPAPISTPPSSTTPHPGYKPTTEAPPTLASLATPNSTSGNDSTYPISATLTPLAPATPAQWSQARPTLTGGMPSGRIVGRCSFDIRYYSSEDPCLSQVHLHK